jgi:type I restriction enzyme S subunit
MFNRVSAETLEPRLDADFYKKEFIENNSKLKAGGAVRLASLINVQKSSYGILPKSEEYVESGLPLIRGGNLCFGQINPPEVHVPKYYIGGKGTAEEGDVLILIKGACIDGPEGIARVSEKERGYLFNGSCYRLAFNKRDTDGYFFLAFSQSRQFLMQKKRQIANTGISYNDENSILGYLIPALSDNTKQYIGDKVRQAEHLRVWAKRIEEQLDTILLPYQPAQKQASNLISKVSIELLTNILTATTYRDHYIKNQKNLREHGKTVSLFDLLNSVTNGFDERVELNEGLPYVKVADVKPGHIDISNAPKVRLSALDDASIKQKPKLGDLLLTRKGSFGIAAVVMESTDFLCSSEVFCCKPSKIEFMPILAWFLNSLAGNMQFWQFSTGTTMPGINQENLASILIPDFSTVNLSEFNRIYEQRFLAKKNADLFTFTAKILVEALIEGQIDESLLIAAQDQLQSGNDSLDRSILARLKTDGLDGSGSPLFADLDQLYALLAQAESGVDLVD